MPRRACHHPSPPLPSASSQPHAPAHDESDHHTGHGSHRRPHGHRRHRHHRHGAHHQPRPHGPAHPKPANAGAAGLHAIAPNDTMVRNTRPSPASGRSGGSLAGSAGSLSEDTPLMSGSAPSSATPSAPSLSSGGRPAANPSTATGRPSTDLEAGHPQTAVGNERPQIPQGVAANEAENNDNGWGTWLLRAGAAILVMPVYLIALSGRYFAGAGRQKMGVTQTIRAFFLTGLASLPKRLLQLPALPLAAMGRLFDVVLRKVTGHEYNQNETDWGRNRTVFGYAFNFLEAAAFRPAAAALWIASRVIDKVHPALQKVFRLPVEDPSERADYSFWQRVGHATLQCMALPVRAVLAVPFILGRTIDALSNRGRPATEIEARSFWGHAWHGVKWGTVAPASPLAGLGWVASKLGPPVSKLLGLKVEEAPQYTGSPLNVFWRWVGHGFLRLVQLPFRAAGVPAAVASWLYNVVPVNWLPKRDAHRRDRGPRTFWSHMWGGTGVMLSTLPSLLGAGLTRALQPLREKLGFDVDHDRALWGWRRSLAGYTGAFMSTVVRTALSPFHALDRLLTWQWKAHEGPNFWGSVGRAAVFGTIGLPFVLLGALFGGIAIARAKRLGTYDANSADNSLVGLAARGWSAVFSTAIVRKIQAMWHWAVVATERVAEWAFGERQRPAGRITAATSPV